MSPKWPTGGDSFTLAGLLPSIAQLSVRVLPLPSGRNALSHRHVAPEANTNPPDVLGSSSGVHSQGVRSLPQLSRSVATLQAARQTHIATLIELRAPAEDV